MKRMLGEGQFAFYGSGLRTKVTGRANIPANRTTIVVSNHCSHLDMGLVKYSLGSYGRKLVALAAKDYFFEGPRWWVAYFEQLTNLQPIGRYGMYKYNNSDHSVLTALLAAENLFGAGHDVWAVNTDTEYHEVRPGR